MLRSCGIRTAQNRGADFIRTIQAAAVSVCMNPHGVHMRQLQVQCKMLNSKDWTAALMVKSRQWRDPAKSREPNHFVSSRRVFGASGAVALLENKMFQVGKLSFFNNAAYRGSLRKLFSRGSTFVWIRPALRWTYARSSHSNASSDWFRKA